MVHKMPPYRNIQWKSKYRHRFHEVRALRALMHAVRALRENGDDMYHFFKNCQMSTFTPVHFTYFLILGSPLGVIQIQNQNDTFKKKMRNMYCGWKMKFQDL